MDVFYNHHYITIRKDGSIINTWSDGPFPNEDISDAICINDKGGYQFRLYPDGEENPPIYDVDGIPLYKWVNGKIVKRSESEIEKDRSEIPTPPPSEMEKLRADVDYLLAMGGLV